MTDAWAEYVEIESLRRSMAWVRCELDAVKRELQERKAGFDANQPRVPAGNPDGGQWTRSDGAPGPQYTDAGRFSDPLVMSDANLEDRVRVAIRRISPTLEAECEAQYQRDIFQCKMVGLRACYAQAMLRLSNCLTGRPVPPLNY
jgi:hypothetical protein